MKNEGSTASGFGLESSSELPLIHSKTMHMINGCKNIQVLPNILAALMTHAEIRIRQPLTMRRWDGH
jgi:hypothetical protein